MRLPQVQSLFRSPVISLFVLDGIANVTDFAFHFWMGRILIPADFAILQTLNSVMLVYTTASGVFQPVIGRFVAEAGAKDHSESIPAIFQAFVRAAFWLGLSLSLLVLLFSNPIARLLNLPAWTIQISAVILLLSSLRPIAAGVLQGQERFISFGFARLSLSLGRILFVFIALQAGLHLSGAVIALPFGWLASVLCAFLLLGKPIWNRSTASSENLLSESWKLSFYALLAYLAFMSLTSLDLIWVNRHMTSEVAGAYSTLVLMRRIVALLPGVAVTVMFPRVAAALAQGLTPHRLLLRTATIILLAGGSITLLYFLCAKPLLGILFGSLYQSASPVLGWMGVAVIGVSLSSIWLNYYLAERPRNFVILLGMAVALEGLLLYVLPVSMQNAVLAFGATGWLLALAGLGLYFYNLRRLPSQQISHA